MSLRERFGEIVFLGNHIHRTKDGVGIDISNIENELLAAVKEERFVRAISADIYNGEPVRWMGYSIQNAKKHLLSGESLPENEMFFAELEDE